MSIVQNIVRRGTLTSRIHGAHNAAGEHTRSAVATFATVARVPRCTDALTDRPHLGLGMHGHNLSNDLVSRNARPAVANQPCMNTFVTRENMRAALDFRAMK